MYSIYSFPRKHLARTLYGDDSKSNVRRIDALLDGESRMTVDLFWALSRLEPLLDIPRSLKDLYERYEIANLRRKRNAKVAPSFDPPSDDRVGGRVRRGPEPDGEGQSG